MNTDKISGFLSRINLAGINAECTLELLNRIQEACVLNIPYENLSILRGEPLPVDADALSTALFVMGESLAMKLYESGTYDFEAIFISSSGNVRATKGLEGLFRAA